MSRWMRDQKLYFQWGILGGGAEDEMWRFLRRLAILS